MSLESGEFSRRRLIGKGLALAGVGSMYFTVLDSQTPLFDKRALGEIPIQRRVTSPRFGRNFLLGVGGFISFKVGMYTHLWDRIKNLPVI